MAEHSGRTRSVWMADTQRPTFSGLNSDESCDVVIVGAGMAGLSTAYFLARSGMSVVVLDGGPIGAGESERTTAHLAFAMDDYYHEIERVHGETGARIAAASHAAAVEEIGRIAARENIQCDYLR